MSKFRKLLARLLSGESDASFAFEEVRSLLLRLGFAERVRGSHHVFTRAGIEERVNLQKGSGGEAKPYQVAQVRRVVEKYSLGGSGEDE